jgi:hypothetical protein
MFAVDSPNEAREKATGMQKRAHPEQDNAGQASSENNLSASSIVSRSLCICSLSTPIRQRVRINERFTEVFGWRAIEVEQGLQKDGLMWLRHLTPASAWQGGHFHSMMHVKAQTEYLGQMAIAASKEAAAAASGRLSSSASSGRSSRSSLPPPSSGLAPDPIAEPIRRRKEGAMVGNGEIHVDQEDSNTDQHGQVGTVGDGVLVVGEMSLQPQRNTGGGSTVWDVSIRLDQATKM